MEALRQYFLSVTAAAIICAVLTGILGKKGTGGGITKLICGIFLSFTVIRPIADIKLDGLSLFTDDILQDAQAAVSIGEEYARNSLADIIKAESEAYILDKAKALGVSVTVSVTVSADAQPVPTEAYITGNVSPYIKSRLQSIISDDLGIAKEYQIWIR